MMTYWPVMMAITIISGEIGNDMSLMVERVTTFFKVRRMTTNCTVREGNDQLYGDYSW